MMSKTYLILTTFTLLAGTLVARANGSSHPNSGSPAAGTALPWLLVADILSQG